MIGTDNQLGYKGSLFEITDPSQKWDSRNFDKLFNVYMSGGTHIATYAQTAIEMAEMLPTDQKIAMFVTDGYCSSVSYLESLKQQAKAKGITLVGVGIGDVSPQVAKAFPNGIYASNGLKLGTFCLSSGSKVQLRTSTSSSRPC